MNISQEESSAQGGCCLCAMQGNNAGNQQMGSNMPGMMPMGMGMPMMGMPGMMGMPMMNPMMAMMNPAMMAGNMGAAAPPGAALSQASAKSQPPMLGSTGGLMPSTQKMESAQLAAGTHLEPGRVPPVLQRERSRSRDVEKAPVAEAPAEEPVREKTPPRCHLHNTKKPNAKCKFCQKWIASQSSHDKEETKDHKDEKPKAMAHPPHPEEEEDYSRRTFKCSSLLKDQIFGSSYFKSLLEVSELEPLTSEIAKYADTLDVYNSGNNVHPSCFICQVYRLFTLPQSEDLDDILQILDSNPSAKVRCAGILFVRFVVPPHRLWEKLEESLFDEQELKYLDGDKQVTTTIQEYVENLLIKDKYYNTPLPRIPVKVRQHLEKELAPLSQFRKRMAAMQKALPKKVAGTAVEVYVDGSWRRGHIKQYIGIHKRRVAIVLENGPTIASHLGKVVLRDEEDTEKKDEKTEAEDDKQEEKSQAKKEKKEEKKKEKEDRHSSSRSRSRSRHRSRSRRRSPDWARYKGPILDASEIERLREKAREDAVVGTGKVYSKRPTTVEGEMWRGSGGDARVSMLGPQHVAGGSTRSSATKPSDPEVSRTRTREEEEEHKRRMREIYEKYGSVSRASAGGGGSQSRSTEIDQPDVLRLG